jgi:hypothetical protein
LRCARFKRQTGKPSMHIPASLKALDECRAKPVQAALFFLL